MVAAAGLGRVGGVEEKSSKSCGQVPAGAENDGDGDGESCVADGHAGCSVLGNRETSMTWPAPRAGPGALAQRQKLAQRVARPAQVLAQLMPDHLLAPLVSGQQAAAQ